MADHHGYMASSSVVPSKVQFLSLAKFRDMVPKHYLSLSPPTVPSGKRKLDQQLTKAFTAAAAAADDDAPALRFYEDQYKIKKKLKKSDVNGNCRLLLPIKSVEYYILPLMGENLAERCRSEDGVKFEVRDADESDESSGYYLDLKKWNNTNYFVLTGNWKRDFVRRKNLDIGDEVGLTFDGSKIFFKLLHKSFFKLLNKN